MTCEQHRHDRGRALRQEGEAADPPAPLTPTELGGDKNEAQMPGGRGRAQHRPSSLLPCSRGPAPPPGCQRNEAKLPESAAASCRPFPTAGRARRWRPRPPQEPAPQRTAAGRQPHLSSFSSSSSSSSSLTVVVDPSCSPSCIRVPEAVSVLLCHRVHGVQRGRQPLRVPALLRGQGMESRLFSDPLPLFQVLAAVRRTRGGALSPSLSLSPGTACRGRCSLGSCWTPAVGFPPGCVP